MIKKVLIIEDNEDVRENTADLLVLANYEVATAENGIIGVKKAKQFEPDVIICDIMMPKLDGYGVLEALIKNKKTASIPFIFLTAKSEKTDVRKGMNLGADDYLTKPFNEDELLDAIESRLKKHDFFKKEFSRNVESLNEFMEEASEYITLESFSKDSHLLKYKKNNTIFMEGTAAHTLYFVQSGTVKTFKATESGKEFVTGLHNSGDFFGQLSLLTNNGNYIESATAIENAEVYAIPKADFSTLIHENIMISDKFISMLSNNLADAQEQLVDLAFEPVRKRVAKTLLDLHNKGIIADNDSSGIGILREDFAGLIGTATETAIRMLTEFKDEGLITTGSGSKLIVLDKKGLENIVNFI